MLQAMGSQRVGCSLATEQQQHRPTSPVRIQLMVLSLGLPPKAEEQWDSGSEWQGLATPCQGAPLELRQVQSCGRPGGGVLCFRWSCFGDMV